LAADYHMGTAGDPILFEEYHRWITQGFAAYHLIDENFSRDHMHPEDRKTQLSDLLCALMHFAQAAHLDFSAALEEAQGNYALERRRTVPKAYVEMCRALSANRK